MNTTEYPPNRQHKPASSRPWPPQAERIPVQTVTLTVTFGIDRLTPRGVRRRFIDALRIAIAQARQSHEIDQAVCEELWRALPSRGHA